MQRQLDDSYEELKATKRQRIRDSMKHPEKEELLEQTYDEMEAELEHRIKGLKNQLELTVNKRNAIIQSTASPWKYSMKSLLRISWTKSILS